MNQEQFEQEIDLVDIVENIYDQILVIRLDLDIKENNIVAISEETKKKLISRLNSCIGHLEYNLRMVKETKEFRNGE